MSKSQISMRHICLILKLALYKCHIIIIIITIDPLQVWVIYRLTLNCRTQMLAMRSFDISLSNMVENRSKWQWLFTPSGFCDVTAISVKHVTLQLYIYYCINSSWSVSVQTVEVGSSLDSMVPAPFVCRVKYRSRNMHRSLLGGRCVSSRW